MSATQDLKSYPDQDRVTSIKATAEAWGSGKLILFGEHAVVYGRPAIAVALNRGLKVTVHADTNQAINSPLSASLSSSGRLGQLARTESQALMTALNQGLKWLQRQRVAVCGEHCFTVEGELPFKVGLGSSAALSVAALRATAKRYGYPLTDQELFEGAMHMERVFHQNPSGLDHQVSILGGALRFKRSESGFENQNLHLRSPLHLTLTWTPRTGSTADAVRGVAMRRSESIDTFERFFSKIESLTDRASQILEGGHSDELGPLLNENHQLLCQLGVSTSILDERCAQLITLGAIGAKMSGAGHGGTCFGLFHSQEEAERAASSMRTNGLNALSITLGDSIEGES